MSKPPSILEHLYQSTSIAVSNSRSQAYFIAKLLLGNPVVDVTLFKIEFCTKICVGFLGTYP